METNELISCIFFFSPRNLHVQDNSVVSLEMACMAIHSQLEHLLLFVRLFLKFLSQSKRGAEFSYRLKCWRGFMHVGSDRQDHIGQDLAGTLELWGFFSSLVKFYVCGRCKPLVVIHVVVKNQRYKWLNPEVRR